PIANAHGSMQYAGAVNQMGVHVHWVTANTHFYARDLREFDQDIEENTLLTDVCVVGKSESGVGTSSPSVLSGLHLTLFSDPGNTVPNSEKPTLEFDNGASLNIGSNSSTG
ncbi:MAG: hypothetical protein ACREBW_03380, partial [Candidatus Micrarchaeaceae archaeon]